MKHELLREYVPQQYQTLIELAGGEAPTEQETYAKVRAYIGPNAMHDLLNDAVALKIIGASPCVTTASTAGQTA